MTVSPLKRLQILQAAEFERWGIRTICINEDTPSDTNLWDKIRDGYFQHLIVQPEQLRTHQGHLPRLARLLSVPRFVKTIARVHIDEAHNHYTAGLPLYGLPPFRPAWGALNELKMRLPKGTPFQALSGTFPPHIKAALIEHLNFDPNTLVSLKLSSNRPNTIYATHQIVGNLKDFRNLDFLVCIPFKPLLKAIVFHDDTQQCADAATYHDSRLPPELQNTGLIRHYHGGMSKEYLTNVYNDFSKEGGVCQILHATEGASTVTSTGKLSGCLFNLIMQGLDVPHIVAVIDYGLPQKKNTSIQRGGRCGRRGQLSVYLVMAELWAYTISLDSVSLDSTDPDRPISGRLLKNSNKSARAGLAMVLYVRSKTCLRKQIRDYLADVSSIALEISKGWCCDRSYPDQPELCFDKRTFFPGRFIYTDETGAIYAGDVDEVDRVHLNPPKGKKRKAKGPPNRKLEYRGPLQDRLRNWLALTHDSDKLRAVRPASFILDTKGIKKLAAVHPSRMTSVAQVITTLEETDEWAAEWGGMVLSIIETFDKEMARLPRKKAQKRGTPEDTTRAEKRPRQDGQVLVELNTNVRRSTRLNAKKWIQ
ncbi:P-loop containing nucleoside triphosphate hydrolase protein [Mycena rebaudengoi]|nr:P-loop containing nucleoside triphosphate hydrolase protein [Mycena rebaudengoi]